MPALTARCMKVNQEMVVCSVYEYSPVVARYSDYMLSAVRQNGVVTSSSRCISQHCPYS
jgi:hypothetical protein